MLKNFQFIILTFKSLDSKTQLKSSEYPWKFFIEIFSYQANNDHRIAKEHLLYALYPYWSKNVG